MKIQEMIDEVTSEIRATVATENSGVKFPVTFSMSLSLNQNGDACTARDAVVGQFNITITLNE